MSTRDNYRSVRPEAAKHGRTCPICGSHTYVTKGGRWYRHRQPPMSFGYGLPLRAGPVCKASGRPAR